MNCGEARSKFHDYLDGELSSSVDSRIDQHLSECASCQPYMDQLRFVRKALAIKHPFPPAARQVAWHQIRQKARQRFWRIPSFSWNRLADYWSGLEAPVLWARVLAVPISLAFFLVILGQIQHVEALYWSYPVVSQSSETGLERTPLVSIVDGRQDRREVRRLIRAVSGIPYEDSMAVLAEINAAGRVEIDDVLIYPRNSKLFDAIGETLRQTSFRPQQGSSRKLIYTFQKIDVYEDFSRGM